MTKRIATSVIRGEIDNTVEGQTTGRLWIEGFHEPVELVLNGDCWRDLAGRCFQFANPIHSRAGDLCLNPQQRGIIGDMTSQFGARSPDRPRDSPTRLPRNRLYLEWFSESDGRVVIDALGFDLAIGERTWEMDEESESAQQFANAHALRDYIRHHGIIHGPPPPQNPVDPPHQPAHGTPSLNAMHREVVAKYQGNPNARSTIAFVMGWDDMLSSYGDDSEQHTRPGNAGESQTGLDDTQANPSPHSADESQPHPIQQQAEALAMRALHLVGGYPDPEGELEETVGALIHHLGEIASKLPRILHQRPQRHAAAQNSLERCFECQQEALSACSELIEQVDDDPLHQRELEALREEILDLHDTLTAIQRKFRKS